MQDRFKFRALVRGYLKLTAEQQYTEIEPLIYLDDIMVLSDNLIRVPRQALEIAISQQCYYLNWRERDDMIRNLQEGKDYDRDNVNLTPEKIFQSTGLRDKNDELIYEYDICRIDGKVAYQLVSWDCKKLNFTIGGYSSEELETFGNIYSILAKGKRIRKIV
jgi:hypothetical protein